MIKFWGIILGVLTFAALSYGKGNNIKIPDISKIPRLSKGLKPGTLAWATIDQLHPTQPQTGFREVQRKSENILELLRKGKFPAAFFEKMYTGSVVPVFIGPGAPSDSRAKTDDVLGYNTDRTHFTFALALALEKIYGKKALSKPIFDDKNRPLNFVLVMVQENKSDLNYSKFADFMTEEGRAYLKYYSEDSDGTTHIQKIAFSSLPEKVYETTDNPFRSVVSWLQRKGFLRRTSTDFSQFKDAEVLAEYSEIKWKDIDEGASKKDFEKSAKKGEDFIESNHPQLQSMPGLFNCTRALQRAS